MRERNRNIDLKNRESSDGLRAKMRREWIEEKGPREKKKDKEEAFPPLMEKKKNESKEKSVHPALIP